MMNRRFLGIMLLLASLVLAAACTGSPVSRGTGEYVSDKAISTQIDAKLAMDPVTKAHQIEVETYRGTVQLSGFVDNQQSVQRATEIARSVEGVKDVRNNLIVKEMRQPQRQ